MQDRYLFSTQSCVLIHNEFGRVRDEKVCVVSNSWQQTFLCVRYSNQKSDAVAVSRQDLITKFIVIKKKMMSDIAQFLQGLAMWELQTHPRWKNL